MRDDEVRNLVLDQLRNAFGGYPYITRMDFRRGGDKELSASGTPKGTPTRQLPPGQRHPRRPVAQLKIPVAAVH